MNVVVEQRNVYGAIKFYPMNPLAEQLASLMKQKTFDAGNLRDIKNMGIAVTIEQKTVSI